MHIISLNRRPLVAVLLKIRACVIQKTRTEMFVGKAKKHMNFQKSGAVVTLLTLSLMSLAWGGTFGTPVPIGGHAADIALDEGRGVLYIANFTANRVDVMSLSDNTVHSSFNTAPQPGSLGLSPDGRYLVAGHFVMGQLCRPPVASGVCRGTLLSLFVYKGAPANRPPVTGRHPPPPTPRSGPGRPSSSSAASRRRSASARSCTGSTWRSPSTRPSR